MYMYTCIYVYYVCVHVYYVYVYMHIIYMNVHIYVIPPLRGIYHIYTHRARGQCEYKCDIYQAGVV